ncbi:MAG TPA: chemotaxis protein CheB [Thermoanaerobaculia bacterium]|nr:chemotaxis protein CheB [Thermoanaerobaculia bacterium]
MTEGPAEEAGVLTEGSPFSVVGIGASAGGLEAFTQMLNALPVDTGMAFVLVQHLAPTHASMLSEILSRSTAMPVTEVHDEPRVEPNRVYVIPPDRNMTISGGVLQLLPREEAPGQHRPIDVFFRSLAEDQKDRAIGVILSGTASDGTLGLQEIKTEGGITFAQNDTAQQDSMPRSAVASGCVDFVLSPAEIAREIGRIARHPYGSPASPARRKAAEGEPHLEEILAILCDVKGVDFSQYKASSLNRRIHRRMILHKLSGVEEYARFLRKNPGEVEVLYQDILIHVTSFFRNPATFAALKATVLPKLFKDRSRDEPLRIWVLGCSTGEEAYSIAITFAEFAEAHGSRLPIQIFATDLNEAVIEKARAGVYPQSIAHDVPPELLQRFFAEVGGSYRISKTIRDMCVFARHNVLTDPPFSQIDLITCRNLLIYLEPALQQRVVPLLHYALKPAGFLLLGSSETIGSYRDLFELADSGHRCYTKKPSSRRLAFGPAAAHRPGRGGPIPGPARRQPADDDVQKEADRILLTRYVPPGVLVNADLEILQFRGDTGPYLAPAPGKASLNLLKMARKGLAVKLRAAINKARKEDAPVREEGLQIDSEGGLREIHLEVVPVKGGSAGGFLVLFQEPARGEAKAASPLARAAAEEQDSEAENTRLVQELAATREYLHSVIEQQEAANEELQSANEEAQSANEELQSINEELETSKEEIQSGSEELATVNDELQNRNAELSLLNNDLFNLLSSVQMAIVIIGQNLRIRRFTPKAEEVFNLLPSDLGRPINDFKLNLSVLDLQPLLAEVIDTASPRECEVQDRNGLWYLLRIQPYRTLENKIDGAVIMLVDIDKLRRAREYAESIVATVSESLLVLDADLCVQTANLSFYQTFEVTPEATEHRYLYELGDGQWNIPELRRLLEKIKPEDQGVEGFEVELELPRIGRKAMLLNARRFVQESGQRPLTLLAIQDITTRKDLERALNQRVEELAAADRSKNEFLALLAHELRNPLAPLRNAVEVLENPGADRAAAERARDMMRRQIQNMARLIEDLLDVSRITRGEVRLRRERIELAVFLERAVGLIRHLVEARGQKLALSLPPEPVYLDADPTRMDQIFGNLLNNASKFTPSGGHLWVTAELAGDGREAPGEVVVRVRDDGAGMAPETLPRVFDLFMQEERSYDRAGGGLGIGLTLVRRLVELHGGSVEAHSEGLGKGSELVVRLPVSLQRTPEPKPEPDGDTAGSTAAPGATSPRRILVVDDNEDSAESLALLLRLRGHEVKVAYNGPEALDTAGSFYPEAVLLDIGLPGLDGYQVASRLRQRPRNAKALLVALTGYGQEDDQRLAREAGFDHHLTKPVDPQVIYELLARPRPAAG